MAANDVVVHRVASFPSAPIESLTDGDIARAYDDVAAAALRALQDGRAAGAMRFVLVLPASGGALTSAATETVRLLALSAARQWADDGVTVNCVVTDGDAASVIEFLSSGAVNGQTVRADGPAPGL